MGSKGVHWIELVELYSEPLLTLLEPAAERIHSRFREEIGFSGSNQQFPGPRSTLKDCKGVHSIELVELYL